MMTLRAPASRWAAALGPVRKKWKPSAFRVLPSISGISRLILGWLRVLQVSCFEYLRN